MNNEEEAMDNRWNGPSDFTRDADGATLSFYPPHAD